MTDRAALSRGPCKQGQGGRFGRPVCDGTVEATEDSCVLSNSKREDWIDLELAQDGSWSRAWGSDQ